MKTIAQLPVQHDEEAGEGILSGKPLSWDDFFVLADQKQADSFEVQRDERVAEERNLF
ncbi:MAG: hypothetical protein LBM56_00995 [Burkholderiaceae bacterium]|jgi:hypothetical protein|nr:hypothetical protein [Burkholderiaceae bacterium]